MDDRWNSRLAIGQANSQAASAEPFDIGMYRGLAERALFIGFGETPMPASP